MQTMCLKQQRRRHECHLPHAKLKANERTKRSEHEIREASENEKDSKNEKGEKYKEICKTGSARM